MVDFNKADEISFRPIVLDFSEVRFFAAEKRMLRSFLTVNSLDLGVLGYEQYRYVARRTKVGNQLVRRHFEKLFRSIPELLSRDPEIDCFTLPVYARMLFDGELASLLVEMKSVYPEIPLAKICVELSADMLYEDLDVAAEKIDELRLLGVRVAIFEVGDRFCPVFRLSEIKFDYAFMDSYSTDSLGDESAERIAGSLAGYLHHLGSLVIAPALDSKEKIESAKLVGADGYTVALEPSLEGGSDDGQ